MGFKIRDLSAAVAVLALAGPAIAAQMVVTIQPQQGGGVPANLRPSDVSVIENKARLPVTGLEKLAGDRAGMQLFILLDDSTRSASLGTQLPELKSFVASLPPSTEVGIGYLQHGTFALAQKFTTDHQAAARALRLPAAMPGENGSPYFGLEDLAKHWPSSEPTDRRVVLLLTDGVDRYYDNYQVDDPYVDSAIHAALKNSVAVYPIYLRGAGFYGRGQWSTNMAQSRLMEVSDQTGGYSYFQDLADPVSIQPFLKDFHDRLEHQYRLTFQAPHHQEIESVKVRTELPGVKIEAPSRVAE